MRSPIHKTQPANTTWGFFIREMHLDFPCMPLPFFSLYKIKLSFFISCLYLFPFFFLDIFVVVYWFVLLFVFFGCFNDQDNCNLSNPFTVFWKQIQIIQFSRLQCLFKGKPYASQSPTFISKHLPGGETIHKDKLFKYEVFFLFFL